MATHGGKRENAGKPKGRVSKKTLEKKAVEAQFAQRVMNVVDSLFNAQYSLAVGSVRVYRVDEEEVSEGKTKRIHTLVTDSDEIKKVLDETNGKGSATIEDDFYFVTEVSPDNKAIDSMLNRALGKPQDSLDVTSKGESIAVRVIEPKQQ